MVDIGSCLQQSLDCLGVSICSSYPQRNNAKLNEKIVVEQRERERERESEKITRYAKVGQKRALSVTCFY